MRNIKYLTRIYKLLFVLLLYCFIVPSMYAQVENVEKANQVKDLLKNPALNNDVYQTNLYTGKANVSIPLYTYKDNDFDLPISLFYTSDGLKTSAPIGVVGLGWNLICGGSITREVRGEPDEGPTVYNQIKSFWDFYRSSPNVVIEENNLINNAVAYARPREVPVLLRYRNDLDASYGAGYETQPDVFHFNFGKHSGSFCLNSNSKISVFNTSQPYGEYKIKIERDDYQNTEALKRLTFVITTGDGYKYTFDAGEKWAGPSSGRFGSSSFENVTLWDMYRSVMSEWPLSQIEAPNGRVLKFEYNIYIQATAQPTYGAYYEWDGFPEYYNNEIKKMKYGYSRSLKRIFTIKKITIDDISIHFDYTSRTNEVIYNSVNPYNKSQLWYDDLRVKDGVNIFHVPTAEKLTSISVSETTNNQESIVKECFLNYIYGRKSDYNTSGRPILFLKNVNITGVGEYSMSYYSESTPFPLIGQGVDHWGYSNGTSESEPSGPKQMNTDNNYEEYHDTEDGNYVNHKAAVKGMLKTITYPTSGYTKFYYEGHDYAYKVTKNLKNNNQNKAYLSYVLQNEDNAGGGVRIKRITDYNPVKQDSVSREFEYMFIDTDGYMDTSSGILLHTPRYFRDFTITQTWKEGDLGYGSNPYLLGAGYNTKTVSSLGDLIHLDDHNHIGYSEVIERFSDGSYWVHKFSDYKLLPDVQDRLLKKNIFTITSSNPTYIDNFFMKYDSRHTQRGKLISKEHFNKGHKKTYSEQYIYDYTKKLKYIPTIELAYSYFYIRKQFIEDYPLTKIIKTTHSEENGQNPVIETSKLYYNNYGQIKETEITNSHKQTISVNKQYITDLAQSPNDQSIYGEMYLKNLLNYPIKIQTSLNKSVISGESYEYKQGYSGLISLSEIRKAEIQNPLSITDFNFDQYLKLNSSYVYDYMGNVIQSIDQSGLSTVYIWGGQYLLAEVKNTSLNKIYEIDRLENIGNRLDITELSENQINALYSIPNAYVTVYKYKPLVGIEMVIDPSRKRTFYKYDDSGRLIEVRDTDDKILELYRYKTVNE